MSGDLGSWSDGDDLAYVVAGLDGLPSLRLATGASMAMPIDVTTISTTVGKSTLDYLYQQAKEIGRVKVEEDWQGKTTEVSIRFTTKGGSTIWAKGEDPDVNVAFERAIKEARSIRDGYR